MKENNIFLKEESLFISKINSLFNNKDYLSIAALRHKVFDNIDLYNDFKLVEIFISKKSIKLHLLYSLVDSLKKQLALLMN